MLYTIETRCRACDGEVETIMAFGEVPLADRLVEPGMDGSRWRAPLSLARCRKCGLVQLRETVDPTVLFYSEYPYFSSVSPALKRHFQGTYHAVCRRKALGADSLVVEAASNDGCLLSHFLERGIPVLGIDPAAAPVRMALNRGIPTREAFFGEELAEELADNGVMADVFIGTNVLAHVADLMGFLKGVKRILKPDGLAIFEVPWLVDMVRKGEFDTVYHQHLCYFSLTSLVLLMRSVDLAVVGVEHISIHGGSLRVVVGHDPMEDGTVSPLLAKEAAMGVSSKGFIAGLESKARRIRCDLRGLLEEFNSNGMKVAAYGAAAKATTFLAYCGIGVEELEFVVDLNAFKQGKMMIGSRLPIVPLEAIEARRPEVLLILAWNFADEIMSQLSSYAEAGGRFVVPVPEVRLIEPPAASRSPAFETATLVGNAIGGTK
jgi:SAM-dependent methyltransferase